ncbi:class I SAM-dependent methyltransferase [SAR116 cluster bacterium]|nr:class I SAM-dependent methyltransferase [SAR116 cluster bacterium]
MFEDVCDLQEYYRSRQGRHVALRMRRTANGFWTDSPNACNAVIGYGIPLMRADDSPAKITMLPMRLGPQAWPRNAPSRTLLVNSSSLPLQNVQLDRLVLFHALEFDPDPGRLLDECWRVLDGAGRILVMVPNRNGLWARAEKTPFGHGRPYSRRQLRDLLRSHGFEPKSAKTVLFMPPASLGLFLRFAPQMERIGRTWSPAVGGVLVIDAEKMLYAPAGKTSLARAKKEAGVRKLAHRPSGAMRDFPRDLDSDAS